MAWTAARETSQRDFSNLDVLEPMYGFCDGYELIRRHPSSDISYRGFYYSDAVVETVKKDNPGLDVWQADATKYMPAANSFDLIILVGGLHHTPLGAQAIVKNLAPSLRAADCLSATKQLMAIRYSGWYATEFTRKTPCSMSKPNARFR
jgi:SAM-dependent methyltransferase